METEEVEPDEEEVCYFFPIIIHNSFIKSIFMAVIVTILLFLSHIPTRRDQINSDNFIFYGLMRRIADG